MPDDGPVLRTDAAGIATLTLNRPAKRNALSVALFVELEAQLAALEAETDTIGVVLLRGAGNCFSAGADLSGPQKSPRRHFQASVIERLAHLPQPVIGVVDGVCFTGGLELALACDLILASTSARFADTHARFAITAGWGMTQRLPRRIGGYRAREMMLTGREYDGRAALALGLVNACVPPDALDAEVEAWCGAILAQSWFSNREHKRMLLDTDGMRLADGLAHEGYRSGGVGPDAADRIAGRFGRSGEEI